MNNYHPCTEVLINGLKGLPGGKEVLQQWDDARAKADADLGNRMADLMKEAAEKIRKLVQTNEDLKSQRDVAKTQLVLDDMMFEDLLTFAIETQRYLEKQEGGWATDLLTVAKSRRQEIEERLAEIRKV